MNKKLFVAKSRAELEKCFLVMRELRPDLTFETYMSVYQNDGYQIVAIEGDDKVLAVMGYRILSDYVRGKHVYIDDLVSSENVSLDSKKLSV